MRIEILSDERIETLATKQNQATIEALIQTSPNNEWLKDIFRDEHPFTSSKIELNDFDMDMSASTPEDTDFENAKRLYEALKHIPESTACDVRLWEGLTFGKFYDYMKYRYNPADQKNYYRIRWIFSSGSKKRDLFRHGLSMLWWYAYLTYDESQSNSYELTEFCFKHKDFLISVYSRSFSGSKNVRLGLIQALRDFERDGGSIEKKEIYNGVVKYISFLGGAYLIDMFSREEIYEKAYNELNRISAELVSKSTKRFTL